VKKLKNEISVDMIDILKEYLVMLEVDDTTANIGYNEQLLYMNFFKDFIHSLSSDDAKYSVFKITDTSVLYLFSLLDSKPERTLKNLKESLRFYNNDGTLETEKKTKFRNALLIMINFLNFSIYIYNYAKINKNKDEVKILRELLITFATSEYENLYSSRNKNAFGYYFDMLLNSNDIATPIEKFNTDKHRANFNNYIKRLKSRIQQIPEEKKMQPFYYSNIVFNIGKMKDDKLPNLKLRNFIAISYSDKPAETPLFITNFS